MHVLACGGAEVGRSSGGKGSGALWLQGQRGWRRRLRLTSGEGTRHRFRDCSRGLSYVCTQWAVFVHCCFRLFRVQTSRPQLSLCPSAQSVVFRVFIHFGSIFSFQAPKAAGRARQHSGAVSPGRRVQQTVQTATIAVAARLRVAAREAARVARQVFRPCFAVPKTCRSHRWLGGVEKGVVEEWRCCARCQKGTRAETLTRSRQMDAHGAQCQRANGRLACSTDTSVVVSS